MEQDTSENIDQFSEMTNDKCIVKSNLCRICAASVDRMCGIFSLEGHAKNLSHKINVYLPFKVTEQDILPLNCCYDCISILSAWHKFVLKSVDANNKLLEVFTKKSFIQNVVPKISNISPNSDSNRVFIDCLPPSNSEEINPKTVKKPKYQNETNSIPNKKTNIYHKVFRKEEFKRSNSFTCDICQIECTDKLKLVLHLRSNHGIPVKKHRGKKDEISANFQCEICEKKFTRKSDASRHKRLKHPEKQPFNSTIVTTNKETILKSKTTINDQTFYKCESCSYLSKKSGNLIRHLTVHSDVFNFCCHICGKNFRLLSALTRHIDLHHHGIKKYPCETCGTKFSSKYSLNEHTNIHLNFKPFVCDICGKSFRHSGTLRGHKLFHTDKCPFRCNYCEKKFRRMADLKTHETMHSGYKKHCCHLCGTTFRLRQALKKHLSVHDKFDESTCQECGLKFGQEKYLKAHQRSHKNLTH